MDQELQHISLERVGETVGPLPSDKLQGSVKHLGIVQPVILAEHANEDGELIYRIVDGNRRIAAARAAGLPSVPAIVVPNLEDDQLAQLTLVANNYRTANYLTEFWAMKQLERSGYERRDILTGAGITASAADTRNLLGTLDRSLFIAFRNGELSPQLAIAAAKLTRGGQDALATAFRTTGTLTRADIDRATQRFGLADPEKNPGLPADLEQAVRSLIEVAKTHGIARTRLTGAIDFFWNHSDDSGSEPETDV